MYFTRISVKNTKINFFMNFIYIIKVNIYKSLIFKQNILNKEE